MKSSGRTLENFKEVVAKESIRKGDFQIIVGGDAYGTGSSREAAVVAHQGANIELVVAHSFRGFSKRIWCMGLPFTTDFSVLDRLEAGKILTLQKFFSTVLPPSCTSSPIGGLLPYG